MSQALQPQGEAFTLVGAISIIGAPCPPGLYDFIPISCRRRPAPFWQNEIPLKNSVESRGCTYPKVTGAKLRGGFYLVTAGLAPAISIIGALCLPVRDRRDNKPGDDKSAAATSFAPLTARRSNALQPLWNFILAHRGFDRALCVVGSLIPRENGGHQSTVWNAS